MLQALRIGQRGREEGDAGVQSIGSAVVDTMPADYFELIWFAIEVVE